MATKKQQFNFLKDIDVQLTKKGFVIWTQETVKIRGKMKKIKHWVIDASLLKEDGEIRMGQKKMYKIEANYNELRNCFEIKKNQRRSKF